ncbi:solute carrier family 22 member 23 [Alosa pseudoharengus]|uniref:solute carrier family 22 member 23 n=1 Tax=Alosa sapidissima TaxID=34773 RepID=UPI001C0A52C6|nr:solute carrier family 22 member 23 [Alosa sapidissima]
MAVVRMDHPPGNGLVGPSPEATPSRPPLLAQVDGVVFPFLGGFGRYQKRLMLLSWIPVLLISCNQFSDYIHLAQPNITCTGNVTGAADADAVPPLNGSTRTPYITDSYEDNGMQCSCSERQIQLEFGLKQNVITEWWLVCEEQWQAHLTHLSFLLGTAIGALLTGAMADWWGRLPVLCMSVCVTTVSGMAVAFARSVLTFSILRFVQGCSLAGISLCLYLLRIELCLPAWRFSMTMVANVLAVGGQLLLPGLAVLSIDWHVLQLVLVCPLALILTYAWLFPESLRWLLATQRFVRAKGQMYLVAQSNSIDTETDETGILSALEAELHQTPESSCILQIIHTRNMWKNILVLCVNSLASSGMGQCFVRAVTGGSFSPFHYLVLVGISMGGSLVLATVVLVMGRRGAQLSFMIITALASLLQLGLLNLIGKYSLRHDIALRDTLNRRLSVALSVIGMLTSNAVNHLSLFICAEITPTVIRGGALGLLMANAAVGMCVSALVDLQKFRGFFLLRIILTCSCLLSIICIPLLPETTGQPLPESMAEGEGLLRRPLPSGEQHHLLTRVEVAEYSRVANTPMHRQGNDTANGIRTS